MRAFMVVALMVAVAFSGCSSEAPADGDTETKTNTVPKQVITNLNQTAPPVFPETFEASYTLSYGRTGAAGSGLHSPGNSCVNLQGPEESYALSAEAVLTWDAVATSTETIELSWSGSGIESNSTTGASPINVKLEGFSESERAQLWFQFRPGTREMVEDFDQEVELDVTLRWVGEGDIEAVTGDC